MNKLLLFAICFTALQGVRSQQQLENPGFESWDDVGSPTEEPTQWSSIKTSDVSSLNSFAPQVISRSTDAHTGSYSLYLENKSAFGIVANGIVTCGRIHADTDPAQGYVFTETSDSKWNTPFSSTPDSLVGWYKYTPSGGDHGKAEIVLHTGTTAQLPENGTASSFVGAARFDLPNSTVSSWTRFSTPFYYFNGGTPSYALMVLTSGDSTQAVNGSKAWFDDVQLIYNPVSVEEISADDFKVFYADGSIQLLAHPEVNENVEIELVDLQGRVNQIVQWQTSSQKTWGAQVIPGVYFVRFNINDRWIVKKLLIQ